MNFWDFARGPASVKLMLEFGQTRGLAEADLLARSRIAPQHLQDPHFELSALQELRVVENLLRLTGHPPGLGLQVGARYRFSTFGLWGYGLVCSANLGEALARALRFIPLSYAYSVIEHHLQDGLCLLRMRPPALAPAVSRFLVERDLAAAAMLGSELGGPGFRLRRFDLQGGHGRVHRPVPGLTEFGGAPIHWQTESYALGFDAAWLQHALPSANPISAAMCDELCLQLMDRWRVREGTRALVQQVLAARTADRPTTAAALAGLTSTSERTLRRRLRAEGTSYRSVRADTLAEQARELLCDAALPVSRIAERLGYADLSSFSQAFKRWQGVSPAAYRRGLAAATPPAVHSLQNRRSPEAVILCGRSLLQKETMATAAKKSGAFMKPLKPSAELAKIVGDEPLARTEVTKRVWDYIKAHNLQNPANKRNILCDAALKGVMGKDEVTMFEMTALVGKHLS